MTILNPKRKSQDPKEEKKTEKDWEKEGCSPFGLKGTEWWFVTTGGPQEKRKELLEG